MRKTREIYDDLPLRADPNYMKMYMAKHRDRLKEHKKKYIENKVQSNPNFWKDRYDPIMAAEYRKQNKPTLSEAQWKRRGIKGMTYDKFLIEVENQNGLCKICRKKMTKPQVDHDHTTGKYRGILCLPCNAGLGIYEKNRTLFMTYLEEGFYNG